MTKHVTETSLVAADEIDAELEKSLATTRGTPKSIRAGQRKISVQ